MASVRRRAVHGDRATITAVPLSSSPEPRECATAAHASLEVNGANLVRTGTGRMVDLGQQRPLLDQIELDASRVLASDDAPDALDDETARSLLVKLARRGAGLKAFLAPLEIDDAATTLSLLVDATTDVLPLEIAYDAPAPALDATLCEHRTGGSMVGKPEVCGNAGETVVCPLAFWGQRRIIARTVRLVPRHGRPRRVELGPLSLRPVLYAATTRADDGVRDRVKPTELLARALADIAGASNVQRVTTWDEWKAAIQRLHPQLLVVLGHTETAGGETILEIGKDSLLHDPDVREDILLGDGSPPPLVILLACSTAVSRNTFGGLTGAFAARGAGAVVATLTKIHGPHGARAAAAVVRSIYEGAAGTEETLGIALTAARRRLVEQGLLDGLLLVSHGEIDLTLTH